MQINPTSFLCVLRLYFFSAEPTQPGETRDAIFVFVLFRSLLRSLLSGAAAASPVGRGAEPAAEQPPRACFHRGHGSGNRRDDTGLPGRARFKRILPIPKPALAQLLGNGGQTVRLGPTWRHNRKVAVRPCAWERGCPVPCSLRGDHSKKAVSGSDPDSSRPALFHRVTMYK